VFDSAELVERARERLKGILVIDFVVPDYYARRPKPCMGGWGRGSINITPAGKVLPCHAAETIPELAFDNVRDRRLSDIWLHSDAFQRFRGTFLWLAFFSGIINILMLTGAMFMLEVYDRVLPSGSVPTLVALAILASALFGSQALLDVIRARILVRVGNSFNRSLGGRLFGAVLQGPLAGKGGGEGLRDLDQIRSFISGSGLLALFDLPWIPAYLAFCFALHFWIGVTVSVGALILLSLTLLTEFQTRKPSAEATIHATRRDAWTQACGRNAEAATAMAMKEDQEKCLAAGANDYLAKPVELERLFSLMRVWMPKLERIL